MLGKACSKVIEFGKEIPKADFFSVVLFQQSTFLIGGERAAILSTVEPITGLFIGALAFQEAISLRTATGSVLVILAGILIAVFDLRRTKQAV